MFDANAAPQTGGTGATILVVEDDRLVAQLARTVLADAGYEVLLASTGEEALALGARPGRRLDIVLTDINLPGVDGWEVARRLAETRPEVRMLTMSASETCAPAQWHGGNQFRGHLSKPFEWSEAKRLIDAALNETHC